MMAKMMIIMMVITMVVMMIMVTVLNGDGGDDLTFQTDENDSDLTTDEDDATALLNKQVSIYDRSVCVYEVSTVDKISDCQPEGSSFNT